MRTQLSQSLFDPLRKKKKKSAHTRCVYIFLGGLCIIKKSKLPAARKKKKPSDVERGEDESKY